MPTREIFEGNLRKMDVLLRAKEQLSKSKVAKKQAKAAGILFLKRNTRVKKEDKGTKGETYEKL